MEAVSAGSSSSGNSYIITAGGRAVILDVGLTAKTIFGALDHLGIDPEQVDALLITHEHIDHVRSLRAVARKCSNAAVFASCGTIARAANFCHVPEERVCPVGAGEVIELGGLTISTFPLSHDASEPLGFTIEAEGEKLAVVTDTGTVTEEIYEAVRDADMLVFEANHDVEMLMYGEYPYNVKVRIKSDLGHLSNDSAGEVLVRILTERAQRKMTFEEDGPAGPANGDRHAAGRYDGNASGAQKPLRVMLAHLSFNNNIPLFARQTVEDALGAAGFHKGTDYLLEVAAKEGLTYMPAAERAGS